MEPFDNKSTPRSHHPNFDWMESARGFNQIQQAEKRKKTWPSHYTRYIKALQAKLNNEEWAKELTLKEVEHKLYMDETNAQS